MIVVALVQIKCPMTANLTSRAIQVLGLAVLTPESAKVAAEELTCEQETALDALDQIFFRYEDHLDLKLFAYIRANQESIHF
jgi:hypothetical protein